MKLKLIEVYKERKRLGLTMRMTVHDSLNTDIPDLNAARELKKVLEEPIRSLGIRVPLIWDVAVGKNWADGKKVA